MDSIERIIEDKAAPLMEIPGVVGVGQGVTNQGTECIVIMVTHASSELSEAVRSILGSCPFTIEITGEFQAGPC